MPPIVVHALVIVLLIISIFLIFKNSGQDRYWEERINHYRSSSDSLKNRMKEIDVQLKKKDSIMLVYMSSLDKTLSELNREAQKNKKAIEEQFVEQDSIISEYCREMARYNQVPDVCK